MPPEDHTVPLSSSPGLLRLQDLISVSVSHSIQTSVQPVGAVSKGFLGVSLEAHGRGQETMCALHTTGQEALCVHKLETLDQCQCHSLKQMLSPQT